MIMTAMLAAVISVASVNFLFMSSSCCDKLGHDSEPVKVP